MSLLIAGWTGTEYTPREPVLGCVPFRAKFAGGAPPTTTPLIECEVVGCEVVFRQRRPGHTTCSNACAHTLRRKVRGS